MTFRRTTDLRLCRRIIRVCGVDRSEAVRHNRRPWVNLRCSRRRPHLPGGICSRVGLLRRRRDHDGRRLTAQTAGGTTRRIDVHHHFANAELIKLMADKKTAGWNTWTLIFPAKAIEDMDKGGVQASCFRSPHRASGSERRRNKAAGAIAERIWREDLLGLSGALGLFACLPLPNATNALKEIEYEPSMC